MDNTPALTGASPVLPAREIAATVRFYEEKLGFRPRVQEETFAIVRRDAVEIHFFRCADAGIAENSSCRIAVKNVDTLYEACRAAGIVPPGTGLETRPWGIREFSVVDLNGCQISF